MKMLFLSALLTIAILSSYNCPACDTNNRVSLAPAYYTQLNNLVKNTQEVKTAAVLKNIFSLGSCFHEPIAQIKVNLFCDSFSNYFISIRGGTNRGKEGVVK